MKVIKLICYCAFLFIFMSACGGPDTTASPLTEPVKTPTVSEPEPVAIPEATPETPDATPGEDLNQPPAILTEEAATELILVYAEAMKGGYRDGHIYIHLGDFEFAREYMIDFPDKMLDFVIEEVTRINDYLFEFLVLMEWDTEYPGMYLRDYNFVGIVDGIPFVMINEYGITEDLEYLRENFDMDKYELYHSEHVDDTRPRELNGKTIIEHGDPLFYGFEE